MLYLGKEFRSSFALIEATSGDQVDATLISGVAYKNGVADALSVTINHLNTGLYDIYCTPSTGGGFSAGDTITMIAEAYVDGVEYRLPVCDERLVTELPLSEDIDSLLSSRHGAGAWVSGGAAVVDNAAIAAAVDAQLSASHNTGSWSGVSIADINTYLSAQHGSGSWEGGSSGSGASSVTITVTDGDSGAPIAGAMVKVYNATDTVLIAYGTTNTVGQANFLLDDATYIVRLAKYTVYTFANPLSLVVSGTTTASYTGTLITGGLPPIPEACVITGRCIDGVGNPIANVKVQANAIGDKLVYEDASGSKTSVDSDPIRTVTDTNGVWDLTLIRSAYLYREGVAGVQYRIKIKGRGLDEEKNVTIPDQDSANYEDL